MRASRCIGLALAVFLAVGGCNKEQPPTRRLEGNRGAIGPGDIRALNPDEPKPPSAPKKP
jgi:hypothetical protein